MIQDFGALNLGLGAAALVAAVTLTGSATTAAWLVYSVPHLAFHAIHGRPFDVGDDVAVLATLAAGAVAAALALWLVATTPARRFPRRAEEPRPSSIQDETMSAPTGPPGSCSPGRTA